MFAVDRARCRRRERALDRAGSARLHRSGRSFVYVDVRPAASSTAIVDVGRRRAPSSGYSAAFAPAIASSSTARSCCGKKKRSGRADGQEASSRSRCISRCSWCCSSVLFIAGGIVGVPIAAGRGLSRRHRHAGRPSSRCFPATRPRKSRSRSPSRSRSRSPACRTPCACSRTRSSACRS